MQCLPLDQPQHPLGLPPIFRPDPPRLIAPPIYRVAKHRMPDMCHMHADLVGPPRLQPALDQRGKRVTLADDEIGRRIPPTRHHRHLLAVFRVAVDRRRHPPCVVPAHAPHQRRVAPFDFALLQARRQRPVRGIVLGHHHQPAGLLVEPVHNPRPQHAIYARQIAAVVQERIDQRAVGSTRCRMYGHPRRLIYDQQVGILVDDIQG